MAYLDRPEIGDAPPSGGGGGTPEDIGFEAVFDIDIVKEEATSILKILIYANLASGDDLQFHALIALDDITIQTTGANMIFDNVSSAARAPMVMFAYEEAVPAGTHNVKVYFVNNEPDSALTIEQGATIEITELKNAAV